MFHYPSYRSVAGEIVEMVFFSFLMRTARKQWFTESLGIVVSVFEVEKGWLMFPRIIDFEVGTRFI